MLASAALAAARPGISGLLADLGQEGSGQPDVFYSFILCLGQRPAWGQPAHGNGRDTRLSRCSEPDALRCCITSAGVLLAKASHVAELSIKR